MRIRVLLGLLVMMLATAEQSFGEEAIEWLRSAQEAADVAQRTGRPILVYIRSANCHYCDLMQRKVWQDPETVARVNQEFVPLKLTQEENADAVGVMQIKGFPSTLVFTADRKFAHRVDGYIEPIKFKVELDKAQLIANPTIRLGKRQ